MPRRRAEGGPAAGLWTLAAGWGKAAERRFGQAWVVTLDGVVSPDEVLGFADPAPGIAPAPAEASGAADGGPDRGQGRGAGAGRTRRSPHRGTAPSGATATSRWCGSTTICSSRPVRRSRVATAARSCRSSTRPLVWEARRWGVARPGWGRLVERYGEWPQLRASDVVACLSDEVAREVVRLGVPRERIVFSPTAVDIDRFAPAAPSAARRAALGLGRRLRRRVGRDVPPLPGPRHRRRRLRSAAPVGPARALLLVGDGAERGHVEGAVDDAGMRDGVVFTGAVGARAVADYLNLMDVAVVSARAGDGFHYSPLKLREYLACGLAVLAPRVGEIPGFVTDGVHALLYQPGDAKDFARKLRQLHDDPDLRVRLGTAGRALVLDTATWDTRLTELLDSAPFRAAVARISDSA